MKFAKFIFLWFAAFLLIAGQGLSRETTSSPQAREPLVIQRISESVTLDGLSSEDGIGLTTAAGPS